MLIAAEAAASSELALCGAPGNPSACAGVQGELRVRGPSQDSGAHDRDEVGVDGWMGALRAASPSETLG
eukprot:7313098-Alexandrium_andersonii.AAC.1